MADLTTIFVPDIGDFDEVEVIEVLVNVGDEISIDDSLITLESDKASMEIPAEASGIIKAIHLQVGEKVKKGSPLLELEMANSTNKETTTQTNKTPEIAQVAEATIQDIVVPDIGDFDEVEVIEILVSVNDDINKEDSLVTLESDKASMEIPSDLTGTIKSLAIKVGDKVKKGSVIGTISTKSVANNTTQTLTQEAPKTTQAPATQSTTSAPIDSSLVGHASPSIRKLARELGADLSKIRGTGVKSRILESDLKAFIKNILINGQSGTGLPSIPTIDFSQFGEIETQPLSRINKLSGKHLTACWLNIPHVTQFDEVDINTMEAFRVKQKNKGIKLTPLVFIMKALVQTLKQFPKFNASLAGDDLIIKKYFNLGVAVNTPKGLIVPVIRDIDQKSLIELAKELGEVSLRARDGKLTSKDLSGGCMTVSSLGGIGGTQFTPIVNAPEVAILGVSRSYMKPVWNGEEFEPKLMLPLALSYDHRVIDGAQGAEFITTLNKTLSDIREILL
jgi:pyruvate dehydrogenase E2 component (dihydrolipoamide acetyltransferase)